MSTPIRTSSNPTSTTMISGLSVQRMSLLDRCPTPIRQVPPVGTNDTVTVVRSSSDEEDETPTTSSSSTSPTPTTQNTLNPNKRTKPSSSPSTTTSQIVGSARGKRVKTDTPKLAKDRLKLRLDFYGLQEKKVSSNGNCQFESLSDQLFGDPRYHAVVRQRVVSQLTEHPEFYSAFAPGVWEEYLEHMSRARTWGDAVTLQAAADTFGVSIILVSSFQQDSIIEIAPQAQQTPQVPQKDSLPHDSNNVQHNVQQHQPPHDSDNVQQQQQPQKQLQQQPSPPPPQQQQQQPPPQQQQRQQPPQPQEQQQQQQQQQPPPPEQQQQPPIFFQPLQQHQTLSSSLSLSSLSSSPPPQQQPPSQVEITSTSPLSPTTMSPTTTIPTTTTTTTITTPTTTTATTTPPLLSLAMPTTVAPVNAHETVDLTRSQIVITDDGQLQSIVPSVADKRTLWLGFFHEVHYTPLYPKTEPKTWSDCTVM